jgi:hypothetical protein
VYAAGLAAFLHIALASPIEPLTMEAWADRPWVLALSAAAWHGAVAVCVCLGLVGLFRASLVARALSLYALWFAYYYLTTTGDALHRVWTEVTWYTVGIPGTFIHSMAGEGTILAGIFWCVYALVAWTVIRPVVKRAFPKLMWLETGILKVGLLVKRLVRSAM